MLVFAVLVPVAALAIPVVYPNNGDYYIVPRANNNFTIDVKGGGNAAQTPIWLYEKNNSAAQIFTLRRVNGDWYTITHKASGHVINVQGGNSNNDARLWLYPNDKTDSCYWRFGNLGNGYYLIQSKLRGNRIIDLDNNRAFNGAIVHLWDTHSGASASWKLVPVSGGGGGQTKRQALQTVPAYTDSALSKRNGNERVDKGDMVTVLQETSNAYYVRYPVSNGTKDRWVSKTVFTSSNPSSGYANPISVAGAYWGNYNLAGNGGFKHDILASGINGKPVYAIQDGTIQCRQIIGTKGNYNGKLVSYGNVIYFTSSDGKTKARYAHLSGFTKCKPVVTVSAGSGSTYTVAGTRYQELGSYTVKKGEIIGYVGTTGNSSGPHLHFELRINDKQVAPEKYIGIN
ncbi:MAG: RICIN domain-containing protein [Synergistaceae bacterium]|nr:RICIN domain-containing protein [Synergistaceae bacterium]